MEPETFPQRATPGSTRSDPIGFFTLTPMSAWACPTAGAVAYYVDPAALAQFVRFRPKTGYTRYREARLFRSDPRLRFAGQIHETMTPVLVDLAARRIADPASSVEIDHLGYDGDQTAKHARNLPLLERAAREQPGRVYYWHHLAETLAALGRPGEALAAAARGLAAAEGEADEKQRADASMIFQTMARLQRKQGQDLLALIEARAGALPRRSPPAFPARARPFRCRAPGARRRRRDVVVGRSRRSQRRIAGVRYGDLRRKGVRDRGARLPASGQTPAAADWFAEAARLAPDSNI